MKYFIAIALIAAVASAGVTTRHTVLSSELAEVAQIVAAIQSPSTDPATAVALEAMLMDLLGASPISVGPAIVDINPTVVEPEPIAAEVAQIIAAIQSPSTDPATAAALEAMLMDLLGASPISVGPAIVDIEPTVVVEHEPIVVSPAPVNPVDGIFVNPSPVVTPVAPVAESAASPLVQIIVNVQKAEDVASVVAPVPVAPVPSPVVEEVFVPGPVNVVDSVDISPVSPVQVATPVVVDPVQVATPVVVDPVQVATPVVVEPVQVGTPVIPEIVVNPIESLN